MKIARVTPVFKPGDTSLMTNYQPIYVLPCFSKMIERIMNNRLNMLLKTIYYTIPNLGFQKGHSPELLILQVVLFEKMHKELINESNWFNANKK